MEKHTIHQFLQERSAIMEMREAFMKALPFAVLVD